MSKKTGTKILLVLYILFLFYFLLVSELYGRCGSLRGYRYNLVLFREIRRFWTYRRQLGAAAAAANLLGNVLIFLPFGFFTSMASRSRSFSGAAASSFALSLLVELIQLVMKVGCFDVDDLFLNTMGGMLGYISFAAYSRIRRRYAEKKR